MQGILIQVCLAVQVHVKATRFPGDEDKMDDG